MSGSAAATMLRDNPPLFAMAYRFNCQPALDVHPAHLDGVVDAGAYARLCRSPRGERALSEQLTRRFEFATDGHWQWEDRPSRMAMLDRDRLHRLTILLGAARLHGAIRRVVQRDQLLKLRQAIGDDGYAFAVKRASFLPNAGDGAAALPADEDYRGWVERAGLEQLSACWADGPVALHERLRLKLHPGADASPAANRDAAYRLARRVLQEEIAPELSPCFN